MEQDINYKHKNQQLHTCVTVSIRYHDCCFQFCIILYSQRHHFPDSSQCVTDITAKQWIIYSYSALQHYSSCSCITKCITGFLAVIYSLLLYNWKFSLQSVAKAKSSVNVYMIIKQPSMWIHVYLCVTVMIMYTCHSCRHSLMLRASVHPETIKQCTK